MYTVFALSDTASICTIAPPVSLYLSLSVCLSLSFMKTLYNIYLYDCQIIHPEENIELSPPRCPYIYKLEIFHITCSREFIIIIIKCKVCHSFKLQSDMYSRMTFQVALSDSCHLVSHTYNRRCPD